VSTSRTTETQPLPSSGKAQRYDSDRLGRRATLKSLVAAKRSPILGYNHNVRYRGIVFHIQTEDSGIINPHVFTHLFHGGVIISTRKLVYDPDANDDAVKSLMQAQHKAVMKDLRRGTFDDKIDSYLGGTPGLLPREVAIEAADPGVGPELPPPALAAPAALAPAPVAPVEPVRPRLPSPSRWSSSPGRRRRPRTPSSRSSRPHPFRRSPRCRSVAPRPSSRAPTACRR
jgi:hypothetical protein